MQKKITDQNRFLVLSYLFQIIVLLDKYFNQSQKHLNEYRGVS